MSNWRSYCDFVLTNKVIEENMKALTNTALFLLVLAVTLPLAQAQTFTALHQFDTLDQAFPEGSVVRDSAGNLYGTTVTAGSVFKIDRNGNESILALINGGELGIFPTGSLALDPAGNLYGVAEGGSGG